MKLDDVLTRLERAVTLASDDAAIRVHAEYEPQAGAGAKVYPPTYLLSDGSRYHFEHRWGADGGEVKVVVLSSTQAQANNVEAALLDHAVALGIPQLVMELETRDRTVRVSSLEAPHRSRDAYFLDSEIDGLPFDKSEVGRALARVDATDATAALRHAPYDLVLGVWDSHRGKRLPTKFARSYTSEMLGWDVIEGKKGATKGDPLNLPGQTSVKLSDWRPETTAKQAKKGEVALNELGHGMIPGQPDSTVGGVSVRTITRQAVLSLTGLARLRFPLDSRDVDVPGRAALAALALAGDRLAFGGAGLNLRSGSDLVLLGERLEWVMRGGRAEQLELSSSAAVELLGLARERLATAGVEWSGTPVVLTPSQRLREIIEQTFYVPVLDEGQ